jgi:hypothetical protein
VLHRKKGLDMNAARKTWVYLLTAALIVSGVALIAMMVIIVGNSLGRADIQ